MLLDSVSNFKYENYTPLKARSLNSIPVSFKSSKDVYIPSVRIVESEFAENIPDEIRSGIEKKVLDIINGENKIIIGSGANGAVYKLYDTASKNSYAIKVPHLESKNPKTGEKQKVNYDFKNEKEILKSIDSLDSNFQKFVGYLKLSDGKNVLITTYINGMTPDISEKRLNEKSLLSILDMLYELDCTNILHRDLKKENIKINQYNQAGIFDFSEGIKFDIFDTKTNTEENSFPVFEAPTNLRNFEDTLLTPYVNEISKINSKKAKEFFRQYLQMKSNFHYKKAEYLANKLQDENLDNEDKEKLENMIAYEETLSEVFKNPDDDVIATELYKNNITYNSELAYKNEVLLLNPLANIALKANALIETKKLENFVDNKLKKPNTVEKRAYYNYRLNEAKFRQQKVASWMQGLTNWFLNCLTTDINTDDKNKKALIEQCINKDDLNEFTIPNIKFDN